MKGIELARTMMDWFNQGYDQGYEVGYQTALRDHGISDLPELPDLKPKPKKRRKRG